MYPLILVEFPNDNILSHLMIRPDIRFDYSDKALYADGDHNQVTFNVDALFTF